MSSPTLLISAARVIAADRQTLFDLVADPANHPRIDGSNTVHAVRPDAPSRLSLGAHFGMDMHLAADYRINNRVVEFEEGQLIAWRHFNGHLWRYRFADVSVKAGVATLVTEEWDARNAKHRFALRLLGFPARNRRAIEQTLPRLAELAAAQDGLSTTS